MKQQWLIYESYCIDCSNELFICNTEQEADKLISLLEREIKEDDYLKKLALHIESIIECKRLVVNDKNWYPWWQKVNTLFMIKYKKTISNILSENSAKFYYYKKSLPVLSDTL